MKKFVLFVLLIGGFSTIWLYLTERTGLLPLANANLDVYFTEDSKGAVTMRWNPLPYPCRYEVECFFKTTGRLTNGVPQLRRVFSSSTKEAAFQVPPTSVPMFYRVSAYGIFGKLTGTLAPAVHPAYAQPYKPDIILKYTEVQHV